MPFKLILFLITIRKKKFNELALSFIDELNILELITKLTINCNFVLQFCKYLARVEITIVAKSLVIPSDYHRCQVLLWSYR